jgi:hypothetical protein
MGNLVRHLQDDAYWQGALIKRSGLSIHGPGPSKIVFEGIGDANVGKERESKVLKPMLGVPVT